MWYTVGEIDRASKSLWSQFWDKRTIIWTMKYGECAGLDGWERDEFDADRNASYVVLIQGASKVIAGTRIIHADPALGTQLPLEVCSGYTIKERAAEVSRFFFSAQNLKLNFRLISLRF
jgi:N-acyl-L-homoserine lactone synthetase